MAGAPACTLDNDDINHPSTIQGEHPIMAIPTATRTLIRSTLETHLRNKKQGIVDMALLHKLDAFTWKNVETVMLDLAREAHSMPNHEFSDWAEEWLDSRADR